MQKMRKKFTLTIEISKIRAKIVVKAVVLGIFCMLRRGRIYLLFFGS